MAGKRGRPAYRPTATQRRRIMRGIAVGLTLQQLADDLSMPLGSMRRTFAHEIKTARVRLILDNLDRLHAVADRGNVSAMKALAVMMQPTAKAEDAEREDTWSDVASDPAFLSRNLDLH
jgi:hypothetical protein